MDDKEIYKPIGWSVARKGCDVFICWMGKVGAMMVWVVVAAATSQGAEQTRPKEPLRWEPDLKTAWCAVREHERPLLLFLTMDNCAHCEKMKQTTFQDKDVQRDIESWFVAVSLNVKDEPDFVKLLGVKIFPATVIIRPNGDVVESLRGYQTAKQFREKLLSTTRQASLETDQQSRR